MRRGAARADQLDELQPEPLGQVRREAQHAVERVVDLEEGADARALGRGSRWRRARSSAAFSLAKTPRSVAQRRDAGALVLAEADADLVFLDHGHIGVGGGLRAADQRLDGGEARLAGLGVQRLQRREPPPAGDQAVGQGAARAVAAAASPRSGCAGRGRGARSRRAAISASSAGRRSRARWSGAMASSGRSSTMRPVVAGAAQRLGQLLERRGAGGLGGDPGDRRRGASAAERAGCSARGTSSPARRRRMRGGQAAAGHQASSPPSGRAAAAASSSRRQAASSSRLKPA